MAASFFGRRFGRQKRRERTTSVLLVAAGAVAGIALGMVIADRTGGLYGLLRRGTGNGRGGKRRAVTGTVAGWRRDEQRSETFDEMLDDDSELSPESIAHMHVRSNTPAHATRVPASPQSTPRDRDSGIRALPVRHTPDEAALEARVLEAFINDPVLRERAIDICASGTGTIELTGWVQASSEIGHALTLARGVPDVTAVIDRLAVRGAEPSRDHSGYRYAGPPPGGEASPLRAD